MTPDRLNPKIHLKKFNFKAAVVDAISSAMMWRLWLRLASDDLRVRYMRTKLGPFWQTFGLIIYIGGLGVIWGKLFNINLQEFFPYMATGLILWHFISSAVSEASSTFIASNAIISSIPLPLSFHVNRQVVRLMITLAHTLPVAYGVAFLAGVDFNAAHFLVIPALFVYAVNAWWLSLFLGVFGARYRDLGQVISTVMPFLFFVTPILWQGKMLGNLSYLSTWNPITHYIEIVRQPMLGHIPTLTSISIVMALSICGVFTAVLTFARLRHRIAFWL